MTTTNLMMKTALAYAKRGYPVFPVRGKWPAIKMCEIAERQDLRGDALKRHVDDCTLDGHGFYDATTDVALIEEWWTRYPSAGVAMRTGLTSGVFVLDVDVEHGGDETLSDLCASYSALPETPIVLTGGGGSHYWFKMPAEEFRNTTGALGPGLDTRGEGGYVVVPRSPHKSGRQYEWDSDAHIDDIPLSEPPEWLLSLLRLKKANPTPIPQDGETETFQEGTRNTSLFRLGASLRGHGMDGEVIEAALLAANHAHCDPPLPDHEVLNIAGSAARYAPGPSAPELRLPSPAATQPDAYTPIDWPVFWTTDHHEGEWLAEPLLPRYRAIATFSPAGGGKSLLTLDVAARLATGSPVLDQPAGEPVDVVYVDMEMTEGDLYERLRDMGYGPETDFEHLHYYMLPDIPPLDTVNGGAVLRTIANEHDAALVIIDTTSRVLSGEENDADTLRAFYSYTGLPLKADGRTVWRLDHAGKNVDRGQRGTSAKNDDVDLVWLLTVREGNALRLRATKRRQSWIPETVELVRFEDPLRHERATESWPARTAEIAQALDDLGAPLDIGRPRARDLLKEHEIAAPNEALSAALRYRRSDLRPSRTVPRTAEIDTPRSPMRTATDSPDFRFKTATDSATDNDGQGGAASTDSSASLDADSPGGAAPATCAYCENNTADGGLDHDGEPWCQVCRDREFDADARGGVN